MEIKLDTISNEELLKGAATTGLAAMEFIINDQSKTDKKEVNLYM